MKRIITFLTAVILLILSAGCANINVQMPEPEATAYTEDLSGAEGLSEADMPSGDAGETKNKSAPESSIDEDGEYTSKDDVALYIHTYNKLPKNFITKDEAEDLGWHGGGLDKYAPGMSIGGDRFGNYEGNLPEKRGRTYHECDIDTRGKKSRGAKRIVFSNDGLVYYTDDHYETFELLYGEE